MSTSDKAVTGRNYGTPDGATKEERQAGTSPASSVFSVDEIMWQVRAELNRLRKDHPSRAGASADTRRFDLSMPSWTPAVPQLVIKDTYELSELLAFSDADFINAAYRAILRRAPDERGFKHYLQALRGGGSPKILILRDFLLTSEGQATGVRIQGLALPALLDQWRRKRFVGPIIAWIHAVLRLGTLADRQATQEEKQARETQELGRLINETSDLLMHRIIALKTQFAGQAGTIEIDALKNDHESTKTRVARLETEVVRESAEARTKEVPLALEPFYAAFGDHFREDRSVIRARFQLYLALVREAGAGTAEAPIVDVGCGRGEWLDILQECGLIGRGIEVNRAFIDMCRERGLEVLEGDAIQALRGMPDGSAGAITSMHVIEHLPLERAIALLDEARRVLRPHGLIILDTPNPENLSVGHQWFYMDPTRRPPMPPEALRWTVEARGFSEVRIERLVTAQDRNIPKPVSKDVPGAEAINALLASMNASRAYAIFGKRP
jgi:O-antigen chain-terminating methyltransferase